MALGKRQKTVKIDADQFEEYVNAMQRIATASEHTYKLHLKWFKKAYPPKKK